MSTRVYDLSKQLGITNKELVSFFKEHGFTVTSIGVVPDDTLALVKKHFGTGNELPKKEQKVDKANAAKAKVAKADETKIAEKELPLAKEMPTQEKVMQQSAVAPLEKKDQSVKKETGIKAPEKKSAGPVMQKNNIGDRRPPMAPMQPKQPVTVGPQPIEIMPMTVAELAHIAAKQVSEVILTLLKKGIAATKNQLLSEKTVRELAQIYGLTIKETAKQAAKEETKAAVEQAGTWVTRPPIVVVIGHVDHGKTTLLDFIRKTRVAAKEKGGITQHLGAYEVVAPQGPLVFLDTPGHEAFSLIRVRGLKVADIAILLVAADDGVMPQTIEAIKRAQQANIPIIVALNKIDKATPAQIEIVKKQLTQYNLVPEDWGGQTVCMPISAKLGTGIDELLDVIVLQSQLMELKANISVDAQGYVLESKLEKGRGPVATVICQHGELHVGDYLAAGDTMGKVSSLVDSYGRRVAKVGPAMPVQVAGFEQLPQAGDYFQVGSIDVIRKGTLVQQKVENIAKGATLGENELTIIIKADNASSKEALVNSIRKIKSDNRAIGIIYAGVGDVSESDITLAADTNSLIYAFHVKMQPNAVSLMHKKKVAVKTFDIIYKLLEELESLLIAGKPIKMISKKIGEATILKVFDIKNLGIVAGAVVKSGRFIKDGKVIIWRGKRKVGEGAIKGLQRDRKAVKEVHTGFECAFLVDGFDTWEVDDRVECFEEVQAPS